MVPRVEIIVMFSCVVGLNDIYVSLTIGVSLAWDVVFFGSARDFFYAFRKGGLLSGGFVVIYVGSSNSIKNRDVIGSQGVSRFHKGTNV